MAKLSDLVTRKWFAVAVLVPVLGVAGAHGASAVPVQAPADAAAPGFQLPFPCDQKWVGSTYTDHNPQNSVDFNRADDMGDPVVAAAAGEVSRVDNEGDTSYGRWIEIDHGNGWTTRYAHLSKQSVSQGAQVKKGQPIGDLGNSGGSTGPHLHFEERQNGVAVKATFDGTQAHYWGQKTYTSKNSC